jgi:hypothetical protein
MAQGGRSRLTFIDDHDLLLVFDSGVPLAWHISLSLRRDISRKGSAKNRIVIFIQEISEYHCSKFGTEISPEPKIIMAPS